MQPDKWARKFVDNQKNSCSSTRTMWNRNKSLCFLALHCIAAYHSFNDGSFLYQGTGAPVCIQNWLQKLHFSSLNNLLIHQCSSSSLYPLQSSTAHHYIYASMYKSQSNLSLQGIITNAQISLKSHPPRMMTQCINLSNLSSGSIITPYTNLIQGSSSGMHKAVSLFLRSICIPYLWWCLAPAQPPTQE